VGGKQQRKFNERLFVNKKTFTALLLVLFGLITQNTYAVPEQVLDLVGIPTNGAIIASFTVPASSAPITNVVVKISTTVINAHNWDSITNVVRWVHTLGSAGSIQQILDIYVAPGVTYYLALKLQDDTGAWSQVSNVPYATAGSSTYGLTLSWNQSIDAEVVGYKLHYGVASGTYTNSIDVGNVTSATVSNLQYGVEYYFAATSYYSNNAESDFSNEASYP
jgi:hypothetical protein